MEVNQKWGSLTHQLSPKSKLSLLSRIISLSIAQLCPTLLPPLSTLPTDRRFSLTRMSHIISIGLEGLVIGLLMIFVWIALTERIN